MLDADSHTVHVQLFSQQIKAVTYHFPCLACKAHVGTVREGLGQDKLLSVDKCVIGAQIIIRY